MTSKSNSVSLFLGSWFSSSTSSVKSTSMWTQRRHTNVCYVTTQTKCLEKALLIVITKNKTIIKGLTCDF